MRPVPAAREGVGPPRRCPAFSDGDRRSSRGVPGRRAVGGDLVDGGARRALWRRLVASLDDELIAAAARLHQSNLAELLPRNLATAGRRSQPQNTLPSRYRPRSTRRRGSLRGTRRLAGTVLPKRQPLPVDGRGGRRGCPSRARNASQRPGGDKQGTSNGDTRPPAVTARHRALPLSSARWRVTAHGDALRDPPYKQEVAGSSPASPTRRKARRSAGFAGSPADRSSRSCGEGISNSSPDRDDSIQRAIPGSRGYLAPS